MRHFFVLAVVVSLCATTAVYAQRSTELLNRSFAIKVTRLLRF